MPPRPYDGYAASIPRKVTYSFRSGEVKPKLLMAEVVPVV